MAEGNISQKNRRNFVRRKPKGKAKVNCYKGTMDIGSNLAVGLADISESGVMLVLKVDLDKNQDVTLLLEGREHRRPIKAAGKIVWCVAMEGGLFRAGIQLDSYLLYQDIMKIA